MPRARLNLSCSVVRRVGEIACKEEYNAGTRGEAERLPPRALNGCAGERRRGEDVAAFVFEVIHNTVDQSIIAGADVY